jgi:hypothetical protein
MNQEYLTDYSAREAEEIEAFYRKVSQGNIDQNEGFPPKRRFHRPREPFALAAKYQASIWPQIPLCGSLLITIVPRKREEFAEANGFAVADIERLVDFARDTGRVQFGLPTDPLHYVGLDFLDPILTELKPPVIPIISPNLLMEKHVLEKYEIEFYTLAQINFLPNFVMFMKQRVNGVTMEYIEKRADDYRRDYVVLKARGYEDITNRMDDALVSDFSEACKLFAVYGNFLSEPSLFPMKTIFNRTLREIQLASAEKAIKQTEISLPCEIGRFLSRKISLFPESFQACLDVVSKYEQEELGKVLSALNEGLHRKNFDLVNAKSEDISVILENVWNDANKLSRASTILRYGIPLDLAVIGAAIGMTSGPIGTAAGFLAGLGFGVAEETIKVGVGSLSDKIAKFGEPSHISSIFDFQKKVKLG